jgi:prevent-host-death family protein
MKILNIEEASINLAQLIETALKGEDVVITEAGKPLVKLIPYETSTQVRQPGYWEGKVKMADDFDVLPDDIINSFQGE